MAVKIARGTTGQADYIGVGSTTLAPGEWKILDGGGWEWASNISPNGWNVSGSGEVTVPNDAGPGEYRALIFNALEERQDEWGFEVVCMKITIIGLTPVTP